VVNTCSFIEPLKKNPSTYLENAEHKKFGSRKSLLSPLLVDAIATRSSNRFQRWMRCRHGEVERIIEASEGASRSAAATPHFSITI